MVLVVPLCIILPADYAGEQVALAINAAGHDQLPFAFMGSLIAFLLACCLVTSDCLSAQG